MPGYSNYIFLKKTTKLVYIFLFLCLHLFYRSFNWRWRRFNHYLNKVKMKQHYLNHLFKVSNLSFPKAYRAFSAPRMYS